MDDNSLLMIILAFVLGCMCSDMIKKMCGGRLVEGEGFEGFKGADGQLCYSDSQCLSEQCNKIFGSLQKSVGRCVGNYDD